MDSTDIIGAFFYKKLNNENLDKHGDKLSKINQDFRDMIEDSFKSGFEEGEKSGRSDESIFVRGKIIGKLFRNTDLTDDEIYEIVGLGEEKWRDYIMYFREQYDKGKE
jgi:hypothetical protein